MNPIFGDGMLRFTGSRYRIDKLFNAEYESNISNRSGAHPYRRTARGGGRGLKTCKSVKTSRLISFFKSTF
jgi:hypothetical protein